MDIIWNITKRCHHKCAFCANGDFNNSTEMSIDQIDRIIRSISTLHTDDVDLSGGEPLLHPNIFHIIESLNNHYGKKIVSLTSTGKYVNKLDSGFIRDNINCYDFTYDYPYQLSSRHRPIKYNADNLSAANRMIKLGIKTKAQIPLFKKNMDTQIMSMLLNQLSRKGITKVQFIRLMPLGKQKLADYPFEILNRVKIQQVYEYALSLGLDAELHCSLKGVLAKPKSICNMVEEKIGVNHVGVVFSCPWADHLESDDNPFRIGSLLEDDLDNIVSKSADLHAYLRKRCNLFEYVMSINTSNTFNDPLYDY